jgi:tetratricopeptide (TPR) repeat protein
MMKRTLLLFALLFTLPMFAADTDVPSLIAEGVNLYDAAKFDQAVEKFKAALAAEPANDIAAYELGLTYEAKHDMPACIALLEPRVEKEGPYQSQMMSILGDCYDISGDPKKAIRTYRRGLKIDADSDQLLYNLAVTLIAQNQLDEARGLLEKELVIRPDHPSGRYALARTFAAQNFRAPAVIEYLRFLAIEPSSTRAKEAATNMLALLGAGVEVKDAKNITINVDTHARKEEGDYSALEMSFSLAGGAALMTEPDELPVSAFEKKRKQVAMILAFLAEQPAKGSDYTARQNLPFFASLGEQELLDVFAGVVLVSLDLDGVQAWAKENEAAVDKYVAFMRSGGGK